ncbi:hypothetical protein [Micromonospora sediminicola]|uniref:hypothetical protein n=1 Tax=Micromonospora sediminicola TaxID=946078 RepID=UPI003787CD1A
MRATVQPVEVACTPVTSVLWGWLASVLMCALAALLVWWLFRAPQPCDCSHDGEDGDGGDGEGGNQDATVGLTPASRPCVPVVHAPQYRRVDREAADR